VVTALQRDAGIRPSFADSWKRIFLGKPLTSEQLESERLSNPVALGAISPDAISSTAYGPEQVMIELLPRAGMAAFTLLMPIIGVILFILLLVSASYRGVVMTYTRTGGAYMVARDNFGPRIAQIAAAALLIDYVVTAAVQPAAGTVAVVSAVPALGPYHLELTIAILVLICIANLRGLHFRGHHLLVRRDDSADDRDRRDS
jgi:amino acid transporter